MVGTRKKASQIHLLVLSTKISIDHTAILKGLHQMGRSNVAGRFQVGNRASQPEKSVIDPTTAPSVIIRFRHQGLPLGI